MCSGSRAVGRAQRCQADRPGVRVPPELLRSQLNGCGPARHRQVARDSQARQACALSRRVRPQSFLEAHCLARDLPRCDRLAANGTTGSSSPSSLPTNWAMPILPQRFAARASRARRAFQRCLRYKI